MRSVDRFGFRESAEDFFARFPAAFRGQHVDALIAFQYISSFPDFSGRLHQMEENQKALEEKEFTATAGGGAVEVTISGKREVTKVKLQEEVVDPDDIEMLEDLIVAATNEALRKVEEESAAVMSKLTGGLGNLGGGLPF